MCYGHFEETELWSSLLRDSCRADDGASRHRAEPAEPAGSKKPFERDRWFCSFETAYGLVVALRRCSVIQNKILVAAVRSID